MKNYTILLLLYSALMFSCEKTNFDAEIISEEIEQDLELETKKVVFIAGFDEGNNSYYTNARKHFLDRKMKVVEGLFSMEEINHWFNTNALHTTYNEVHIVSHSNSWRGMSLQTTKNGNRITAESLSEAIESKQLPTIINGITEKTQIIFHSCGLGENTALLGQLQKVFSGNNAPKVSAAKHFNVFGGKYASHYLAQPYYVFYPTAQSPGPRALSDEIKTTYPNQNIDWFTALKTRSETGLGTPYSYRFNIPVNWEVRFEETQDIPEFKNTDEIMDWISENEQMALAIYELGIPLEKFRWKTGISGNVLKISGKTTVLCVLKPIMSPIDSSEYGSLDLENKSLYTSI